MRGTAFLVSVFIACFACSSARARVMDSDVYSVAVLGLRSPEGDDDVARSMTDALRSVAKSVPQWNVLERPVSMSQMMLVNGCDEVDTTCLAAIARGLNVDRLVYGSVKSAGSPSRPNFDVTLNLFDRATNAIKATESQFIENTETKKLSKQAQSLIARLTAPDAGRLVLNTNVLNAEVLLDGQPVGQTSDQKLVLDSVPSGEHTLEVSAVDHKRYSSAVSVRKGEETTLIVTLERASAADVAAESEVPPEALVSNSSSSTDGKPRGGSLSWLGYTLLGVGAASAIAWGVSMYIVEHNYNQDDTYQRYRDAYANQTVDACDEALDGNPPAGGNGNGDFSLSKFQGMCRAGRTWQTLQWVFLGTAVAAVGAGSVVLLTQGGKNDARPSRERAALGLSRERNVRPSPRFMLTPQVSQRELGMQATLRF